MSTETAAFAVTIPESGPIWWDSIATADAAATATWTPEQQSLQYAFQCLAYYGPWNTALETFVAAPKGDPAAGAALRAAHDRWFTTATTAFIAAALIRGWTYEDADEALELGDAYEHVYDWVFNGLGFTENAQMDDFVSRLVPERSAPSDAESVAAIAGAPMTVAEMAEGQRTAFAIARAMGSGDTSAIGEVASTFTTIPEARRAVLAMAAMFAWVVKESGMDWDAIGEDMERRLAR